MHPVVANLAVPDSRGPAACVGALDVVIGKVSSSILCVPPDSCRTQRPVVNGLRPALGLDSNRGKDVEALQASSLYFLSLQTKLRAQLVETYREKMT